jgi:surface polysaccharide O-acyltransferase-like enzyme
MASEHVAGRWDNAPVSSTPTAAARTAQSMVSQNLPSDPPRFAPIDNLRAVLVAWVIAGHALLGYTVVGGWPYDEVTEATMPRHLEFILGAILGPTALFVMGTFFFLSGLLASGSIARHGPAGFIRQRLVRLGLPWLLFTLLIWPFLMWAAYRSAGYPLPIWEALQARQPFLDSGPLWFVQILLYVSLAHALLSWGGQAHGFHPRTISLIVVTTGIAAATFVIRIWFPARSQQILDLHLWQWPQCIGLYVLGVLVADQGWAERVPLRTARRCGITVVIAIATGIAVITLLGLSDLTGDGVPFLGGWHWQALSLDVVEATLVVAGSVWLLGWAQRWLTARRGGLTRVARGAYLAYLLQAPVLIGLEIAGRSLDWPALVKALIVAVVAVVGSFGLAWLLTGRMRSGAIE